MVNIMVNIMLIITFGSLDWKVKIVQYAFNEVPETHRKFFLREELLQKDPARCNIMFASSRSRTVAYISYFLLRQLILRHCYYLTIWTQLQSCASHLEILYIVYITDLYIISLLNKIKVILQNDFYLNELMQM